MEHLTQPPPHRSRGSRRQGVADLIEARLNQFSNLDALHGATSLIFTPLEHVPGGSFLGANKHQEHNKCWDGCDTENPTPRVRRQQGITDEVPQDDSDDARHLIRGCQPAPPRRRSGFGDKHRHDGNGKPDSDTQQNPHSKEQSSGRGDCCQDSENSISSRDNQH